MCPRKKIGTAPISVPARQCRREIRNRAVSDRQPGCVVIHRIHAAPLRIYLVARTVRADCAILHDRVDDLRQVSARVGPVSGGTVCIVLVGRQFNAASFDILA